MDEEEQEATKHGFIRMFIHPEEAILVLSCIFWVLNDINNTFTELEKLHTPFGKVIHNGIKNETFVESLNHRRKYSDIAYQDILVSAANHYKKTNDKEGFDIWANRLKQTEELDVAIQLMRNYVLIGSKLEGQPEQQK